MARQPFRDSFKHTHMHTYTEGASAPVPWVVCMRRDRCHTHNVRHSILSAAAWRTEKGGWAPKKDLSIFLALRSCLTRRKSLSVTTPWCTFACLPFAFSTQNSEILFQFRLVEANDDIKNIRSCFLRGKRGLLSCYCYTPTFQWETGTKHLTTGWERCARQLAYVIIRAPYRYVAL